MYVLRRPLHFGCVCVCVCLCAHLWAPVCLPYCFDLSVYDRNCLCVMLNLPVPFYLSLSRPIVSVSSYLFRPPVVYSNKVKHFFLTLSRQRGYLKLSLLDSLPNIARMRLVSSIEHDTSPFDSVTCALGIAFET